MNYSYSNELYHYGVLGMKWGHHKYGDAYTYKSHTTKKYERKMSDAAAKGKELKRRVYENRLNRSKEIDRKQQEYSRQVSVGGNVAARILTGGWNGVGSKAYQMHLAMNSSQTKTGSKVGALVLSKIGRRVIGANLRRAVVIRTGQHGVKKAYRAERKVERAKEKLKKLQAEMKE